MSPEMKLMVTGFTIVLIALIFMNMKIESLEQSVVANARINADQSGATSSQIQRQLDRVQKQAECAQYNLDKATGKTYLFMVGC